MPEKDVFGSPDERDATSAFDKLIEEAAREYADMVDEVKSNMVNRPIGSRKVPPEVEEQEWMLARSDPQHLAQMFVDRQMTVEEMVNYAWEREKKLGGI